MIYFFIVAFILVFLYLSFEMIKFFWKYGKEIKHMTALQTKKANQKLGWYYLAWFFVIFMLSLLFSIGIAGRTFLGAINDFLKLSIKYLLVAAVVIIGFKYIESSKRKHENREDKR